MRQPVDELIACYQDNPYAVAFNICKNQMDAEDVVQETFVQYYTTKKQFEDQQHLRAWLIRFAINKAKNLPRTLTTAMKAMKAHFLIVTRMKWRSTGSSGRWSCHGRRRNYSPSDRR